MSDETIGLLVTALLTFGIGVAMLTLAIFFWRQTRRFLETAVDTEGTIINLATVTRRGETSYRAIVEFDTRDGSRIRWRDKTTSDPPVGQRGDRLPMKYDRANPRNARINLPSRLWFAPRFLGGLAVLFFGVGLCCVVVVVIAPAIDWQQLFS